MRSARWTRGFILVAAALAAILVVGSFLRPRARPEPPPPSPPAGGDAQFAILFGVTDAEPTRWDGSIRASGARITSLDGWRLDEGDRVEETSWRLSTRRVNLTRGSQNEPNPPVLPNGVYVTAKDLDANARFELETSQGAFSFSVQEAVLGKTLHFLDGRATVERIPDTRQLTTSVEEQDFPALAASDDKLYLAYVEFTHGDRSQEWPRQLSEKPASFEPLRRPAGGDQVMLMEYSKSAKTWSPPVAVSKRAQDVYRAAVAVDGEGRVWVIWSAQMDRNFDLFARRREGGRWSEEIRLTKDPGPDLNPVAVTDSNGKVWVTWQGYRRGFDVLVAVQRGDGFSAEQPVSTSAANDWAPQIAAGPNGEVAVAWDTYHKGDYDVYLRRLHDYGSIGMQIPLPVAASRKFEARASIAYGWADRIWVAYEESFPAWGKDFGAYETTGTGLYQGNTVRVKVLEGKSYFQTADSLDTVLERRPASHPFNQRAQRPGRPFIPFTDQPDPGLVRKRPANNTPYPRGYASKGYPRLTATPRGTMVLAYRNAVGNVWGPLGTTWFENVAYFDGKTWTGPVFVAHSDGILDSRPVFAAIDDATVLMAATTDHRFSKSGRIGTGIPGHGENMEGALAPKYNYDLMAYTLRAPHSGESARLTAIPAETAETAMDDVKPELEQVALMRNYRLELGSGDNSETLHLLRGEFHRHTAVSGDGSGDGGLIDAWRYMLDAAYMDWVGCCDHDNGGGREYTWWLTQKMTDAFHIRGKFVPMFSYERSVRYPEGHRNLILAKRGIRSLPRLPRSATDSPPDPAPDTQMLYDYLRYFDGIAAVHTSGTNMGTDWRDNDPKVEPVVEIYQGDRQNYEIPGAPRTNTAEDSIGGWRPLGFVSLALEKGYRLAFQASSDHLSTHMSYCNLWVTEPTRDGLLEAFKKRRVYGATDNILADVRCAGHFMGEEFRLDRAPEIEVKLIGTDTFAKVHIIKDGKYVYSVEPGKKEVQFSWRDNAAERGATSYYYVRGEQSDGELVWVSPMWITVE